MAMSEGQGSNGTARGGGFGQRVDQIGSTAQQLFGDARSAVQDLEQTLDLKGRVARNPYGMVAAALGVGYVLGGGLFTSLTGRLLRLGVRLAALPLVRNELLGIAEQTLDALHRAAAEGGASAPVSEDSKA